MNEEQIWKVRSKVYDQLDWTRRQEYMNAILQACQLKSNHICCDLGTGTGVVAKALSNYCKEVTGVDISQDMLDKANEYQKEKNITYVKGNIETLTNNKEYFVKEQFDVLTARMVFHHLKNWYRAIDQCYKVLKHGGRIVISEGVPPIGARHFQEYFLTTKEDRKVFTTDDLIALLEGQGFINIEFNIHKMENVSIKNWLNNSGLPKEKQDKLYKMRLDSPKYAQKAENMKIYNGDILTDWHFAIVSGVKK